MPEATRSSARWSFTSAMAYSHEARATTNASIRKKPSRTNCACGLRRADAAMGNATTVAAPMRSAHSRPAGFGSKKMWESTHRAARTGKVPSDTSWRASAGSGIPYRA